MRAASFFLFIARVPEGSVNKFSNIDAMTPCKQGGTVNKTE